jgi:hypothetical protein
MTYEEERKLKAALKIGRGAWSCVSGGLLAAGHGLLSGVCRTPAVRIPIARTMIESGQKTFKEGMAEWNK